MTTGRGAGVWDAAGVRVRLRAGWGAVARCTAGLGSACAGACGGAVGRGAAVRRPVGTPGSGCVGVARPGVPAGSVGGGRGAVARWTGEGSVAGEAAASGAVEGRVIGAPIGDRRGADLACGAGESVAERCTGAPSPGRAGGVVAR
ncbi:hypothetical protein [Streptomyces tanashiensis]|uniref:hypothetical protein n=1 Tax=Streptomyces tanashiensis TaxID=67367 RepID=UPI0033E2A488